MFGASASAASADATRALAPVVQTGRANMSTTRVASKRSSRRKRRSRDRGEGDSGKEPLPVVAERWHGGAGMRLLDVEPPAALQAAMQRSRSASELEQLYILFVGATDEETGLSWCPDCEAAKPLLAPRLAALPQTAVVLEAAVTREEWKGEGGGGGGGE